MEFLVLSPEGGVSNAGWGGGGLLNYNPWFSQKCITTNMFSYPIAIGIEIVFNKQL